MKNNSLLTKKQAKFVEAEVQEMLSDKTFLFADCDLVLGSGWLTYNEIMYEEHGEKSCGISLLNEDTNIIFQIEKKKQCLFTLTILPDIFEGDEDQDDDRGIISETNFSTLEKAVKELKRSFNKTY
jgi:hypothetical protein